MESPQQTKGREVQHWLLQAHLHLDRPRGVTPCSIRPRRRQCSPVTPPQPVDFARMASRSHTLFNPAPREAVLGSGSHLANCCSARSGRSSRGFASALPNAGSRGPSARCCAAWQTTSIAIALVCATTNLSPTAGPSPVALSRAQARISSRIDGAFRNALDREDGRSRRPTPSHLLERGLRSHRKGPGASSPQPLERRPKVATLKSIGSV